MLENDEVLAISMVLCFNHVRVIILPGLAVPEGLSLRFTHVMCALPAVPVIGAVSERNTDLENPWEEKPENELEILMLFGGDWNMAEIFFHDISEPDSQLTNSIIFQDG